MEREDIISITKSKVRKERERNQRNLSILKWKSTLRNLLYIHGYEFKYIMNIHIYI